MTTTLSTQDILEAYKQGHKDGYAEGHADALQSAAQHNGDGPTEYRDAFLEIDFGRREVKVQGATCHLTPKEFNILALLVALPNQVLSCIDIQGYVWGDGYSSPDLVKTHVKHLRAALAG